MVLVRIIVDIGIYEMHLYRYDPENRHNPLFVTTLSFVFMTY